MLRPETDPCSSQLQLDLDIADVLGGGDRTGDAFAAIDDDEDSSEVVGAREKAPRAGGEAHVERTEDDERTQSGCAGTDNQESQRGIRERSKRAGRNLNQPSYLSYCKGYNCIRANLGDACWLLSRWSPRAAFKLVAALACSPSVGPCSPLSSSRSLVVRLLSFLSPSPRSTRPGLSAWLL